MSWVRTIADEDAKGTLASIYDESRKKHGRVINLVRVQSLRPDLMEIGRRFYGQLMSGPGALTRLQRVLVATVVSKLNGCRY